MAIMALELDGYTAALLGGLLLATGAAIAHAVWHAAQERRRRREGRLSNGWSPTVGFGNDETSR
ncbi:MAG TPA: hypothetical protein VJ957_03940 [Longimicrobiales bacterium]|nr:hypothetical protein [Longimicrobiales bacterium]